MLSFQRFLISSFVFFCVINGSLFRELQGSFRCDYRYSTKAQAWFKHFVVPATWYDARLRCSLEGAVIASPTTPEIQDEMRNIINTNSRHKYSFFTGIHATFSRGDYYTLKGTPLSKIPVSWAKNEPDNKDNKESCITINGYGELADHRCDEPRPYICYRSETFQGASECGTADPEYNLDKRTDKCYKFHTTPRNFSRAFLACSAEGGHLAIINSETEATVIKELFAKYPDGSMVGNFWKEVAFIGFHDWGENFDWRTIHGQTLTEAGYSKFAPGQPDNAAPGESCGAIFRSGLLDDLWCDRPAAFVCEKSPRHPVTCNIIK